MRARWLFIPCILLLSFGLVVAVLATAGWGAVVASAKAPEPLHVRVNYGHDWIHANYEVGHSVWLTLTEEDGATIRYTASGLTTQIPDWGPGSTGFATGTNVFWAGGVQPDIQAGNWVFVKLDNGQTASIKLGEIDGEINLETNSITGQINANWFTQDLYVQCHVWTPTGGPMKESTAGPDGTPPYSCQWPLSEWDMLPGESVGVSYEGSDGHAVLNAINIPGPHLWINTWADGSPTQGGNFSFYIQYQNDGQAEAEDVVITSTLQGGLTYLSDSSGLMHSGTGTLEDPLVWHLGDLINGPGSYRFVVFAKVEAAAPATISHLVQIDSLVPYSQWDEENKEREWSGQVVPNDTHLNLGINPRTWDPVPGQAYVYEITPCNYGSTASAETVLTSTLGLSNTLVDWWGGQPGWDAVSSEPHRLVVTRPTIQGGQCNPVYVRTLLAENAWAGMEISTTAQITSSTDLEVDDNEITFWHQAGEPHANLSLHKDWTWGQWVPGGDLYYELSYHNNGNLPVDQVFITSTLPAGTTFMGAWYDTETGRHAVVPVHVEPGEYVVWDMGFVENGGHGRFTVRLGVDPQAVPGAPLTHRVEISPQPVEDDFDDNVILWDDELNEPGPNLQVDLSNYNWEDEDILNYELRIRNLGTTLLENFVLTDTYPFSTTFEGNWNVNHGANFNLTEDAAQHRVIFQGDRLDPGSSASISLRVRLNAANARAVPGWALTHRLEAPVAGDMAPQDNYDEVTVLTGPELFIQQRLEAGVPLPGEIITYNVKFGNQQNNNAWWAEVAGIAVFTDTLSANVEFVSAQLRYCGQENWCEVGKYFTQSGNRLNLGLWPIRPGQHNELRLQVRITDTVSGQDILTNRAEIGTTEPEQNIEASYENNRSVLAVPVALPYFSVSKNYLGSQVAGTNVVYTLTVTNQGHVAGTQIELQDALPTALRYESGGTFVDGLVTWSLPLVGPGLEESVFLTATLPCTAGLSIVNEDYLVTQSAQGITSLAGDPANLTVQAPHIQLTAVPSAAEANVGERMTFTVSAETNGLPISNYTWRLDDKVIGTGSQITYAFGSPGNQTVTVTAVDGCEFIQTAIFTIEVKSQNVFIPVIVKK